MANPPPNPNPPNQEPPATQKPVGTAPSFAKAAALPPCPSMVISLSHIDWGKQKPSPAILCSDINSALTAAQNDQVHISAVKWTARDNLVLMGGPNTTAHHLQLSIPTIRQHFSKTYLDPQASHPLHIRPNVKWSKILINSVPTGVTSTSPAYSPDACHTALITENPSYASLNITQQPSWVRNPSSYKDNALSSLVVAFKDPDGSLVHGLLASKTLFIFGTCATIKKWKHKPHPSKDKTPTLNPPELPSTPNNTIDALFQQLDHELSLSLPPTPAPHTAGVTP
ncbi:hypothetical protein H4582DRAFT_2074825 [Lactarius indigo]|nr:hypothetical protein H4582DRAFT_2074825 [Lactarius indigo]